ncbi:tetratricopeptide repeat protein [Pseudobutyrivibrio sp.]|uniref:tetratricopeptide repeat protein n=1 Tax=Pseudobutyrivibrio sp. TaxID=2014367 RepID=UPI001DC425B9|nr:tetratricopeptide repeat protein [Pseudobutyrivibrio sp.]MBE5910788.1 tetratricopeptide repeat protein [Pseudobutyrivibrio sp.]
MASSEQIAKEYYDKGNSLLQANDIEAAIDNYNMAKSIYEELQEHHQYIMTLRGLAISYGIMAFDSKMLYKCLDALNYIDKYKIKGAKHYFYTIICNRYMVLGDYDSAVNYGKMALQDLEDHGTEFDNQPKPYLVACLNLAYAYLHINRYNEAELYLKRAMEIAQKNDLHNHDLSISVLNASLHHKIGDNQYVYDNIDQLVSTIQSYGININDYLADLKLLVETFCSMKEFSRAEAVAANLKSYGTIAGNYYLILEATKLYMMVYKASGEEEKYHQVCVDYAENSISLRNTEANKHLLEMDTAIALSIADTPIELL